MPLREGTLDYGAERPALGIRHPDAVVVFGHDQVMEPSSVHASSQRRLDLVVDRPCPLGEGEEIGECSLVHEIEGPAIFQLGLDLCETLCKTPLLEGSDVVGNRARHGLVSPLEALAPDLACSLLEDAQIVGDFARALPELHFQIGVQFLQLSRREDLPGPLVLDGTLYEMRGKVALSARGPLRPRGAVEVAILRAVATL
ncbi:hypothetical protein [Nocardioides sp. SYSU D00038]|uniref:hypothetical protein n=1 Tax=Nocardioides sp. SYSU D00038 TaxID=2812554 RepID=UPI00196865D8|nr:hypothetical protein [Nocardioides sp. SYSU D00038]